MNLARSLSDNYVDLITSCSSSRVCWRDVRLDALLSDHTLNIDRQRVSVLSAGMSQCLLIPRFQKP